MKDLLPPLHKNHWLFGLQSCRRPESSPSRRQAHFDFVFVFSLQGDVKSTLKVKLDLLGTKTDKDTLESPQLLSKKEFYVTL